MGHDPSDRADIFAEFYASVYKSCLQADAGFPGDDLDIEEVPAVTAAEVEAQLRR